MSKFLERRKKAQQIMAEKGVHAMQVTGRENYYYLTGDVRNVARLFLPREGDPVIIVFAEEVEAARRASGIEDVRGWRTPPELMQHFFGLVREHKLVDKKVGFCIHTNPGFLVYKFLKANPKMNVVENEEILMPLRYAKDADELAAMRRAARVAETGMQAAMAAVKPGVTEIEVAAEAEYAMRRAGAMRFNASTFVDSGPHSLHLHGGAGNRKIEAGDLVVIDLHPVVDMYSSDLARTVVCGEPTKKQQELICLYTEAQQNVIDNLRPGMKVGKITELFKAVFDRTPEGKRWITGPTHGVGLEFEEWPHPSHYFAHVNLEIGENWTLSVGHSILPVPQVGGIKLEDTVLITASGAEKLARDL
ncbi:M24 family metallopeptidase [Desulfotomaculum copahuensis]|uniref:Peptidase M24 n=1 Tax=Desulfotomaculum copahuensis TaxID=1838280 RepID=A0A1B7LHK7_9FIRM|nr:Xaa-Pro peptidase family protein [Desulfotomaculum copahuensis]OAT85780.1 hypothetical protein A6M21_04605 [Desulfotomaculum copahuensis]